MTPKTPNPVDGTAYDDRDRDPHEHEDITDADVNAMLGLLAGVLFVVFTIGFSLGRIWA